MSVKLYDMLNVCIKSLQMNFDILSNFVFLLSCKQKVHVNCESINLE